MSRVEAAPSVEVGNPEYVAFGVGALGTTVFALGPEPDLIFHRHEADVASGKLDSLHHDINSYEDTRQVFDHADGGLKTEVNHYLDGVIAAKQQQIHAVTEHAPHYSFAKRAEMTGISVGELFAVGALFAIGVHRVRKAIANHAAKKQALNQPSVPVDTNV